MPALTCALGERLEMIVDPRRPGENLKQRLGDIIILGFWGGLGGCDDLVESAEWAKGNAVFLRSFLELPQGIPAPDTCTRVFAQLTSVSWQEVVLPGLVARRGRPGAWSHREGKTRRQTGRTPPQLKARHGGRAGAGQTGITLGQVAVAAKAKESTARPQLLAVLDLHDKLVTTDALGCQKAIAEAIIKGGGDYSLAVKDNQPTLPAELPAACATAAMPPARSPRLYTTADPGHGREEQRPVQVRLAPGSLSAVQGAAGLGVLPSVRVTRVVWCEASGVES